MTDALMQCTYSGGPSTIDLSALPQLPDIGALEAGAAALYRAGVSYRDSVGITAQGWGSLAGVYKTPESVQVLAGFDPVKRDAQSVQDGSYAVVQALNTFASTCQEIKSRVDALRGSVADLDRRIVLHGDDWMEDGDLTNTQNRLLSDVNAVQADFMVAEQSCANAIGRVHGGGLLVSAGSSQALADGSNVYAVDAGTLDALGVEGKLPWGRPAEYAHAKGLLGIGEGIVDGVWGLGTGIYSLTGLANWWQPQVDALNLSTPTSSEAWAGVFAIGSAVSVMASPVGRSSVELVDASQTLVSVGKGVIRYDAWAAGDWEYAAGGNVFDVASVVATGGAGAAVKGGAVAGKAGGALGEAAGVAGTGFRGAALAKAGTVASATGRSLTGFGEWAKAPGLGKYLPDSLVVKSSDALASLKTGAWDSVVKPGLEKVAAGFDRLDSGGGGVLVGDGVGAATRGPLGYLADDLRHSADRMDMAVRRPPSIGDVGRGAAVRDTLGSLRSVPHVDPLRPDVTHIVRVPDEMVSGPKSVWTTTTHGFAPNTEYVVAGRGTFITDGLGTIRGVQIERVPGPPHPDLQDPLPNVDYQVKTQGSDALTTFKTGDDGNTVQARVEGLSIGDGGRSPYTQVKVGSGSNVEVLGERSPRGQVSYDGGHLIANMFDGLPEKINMVGMLKDLNRGIGMEKSYYSFEQHIRGLLSQDPPPKIDIQVDLVRRNGMTTPSKIQVQGWADGKQFYDDVFDNIQTKGAP